MVIATNPALDLNSLELLDREDLIKLVTGMAGGGVFLNFHGKRSAMEIAKRVRPRVTRRVSKFVRFQNAVHPGYSGLNEFELEFANALDKSRKTWCRNPSRGGFEIPLLDRGNTKTFNPDFLVWVKKLVIAIDTKGDHLIVEDAGRKLFFIEPTKGGARLVIRLVTQGRWHAREIGKIAGTDGYTVWSLKNGKPHLLHCRSIAKAVEACTQD